jgi:hypothetical protein
MYQLAIMAAGSLLSSGGQAYGASQAIKQGKYQRDILGYAADYQSALVKIEQAKLDRVRDQTISAQTAQTARAPAKAPADDWGDDGVPF